MNYNDFISLLNKNKPFAFSRWGDGEWLNIRKVKGSNCDGNIYYPDLGDKLKTIVSKKQDYYLGCQMIKHLTSDKDKYNQDWFDSDILHNASLNNELYKFEIERFNFEFINKG